VLFNSFSINITWDRDVEATASVEDCLYKAKWGMKEHIDLLIQRKLPVPSKNSDPKIIIQNEKKLAAA
jgi:hypothetical protein